MVGTLRSNTGPWYGMVGYGMVRSMVRTGPPRLARDNGQGQGGHAGYVPASPSRESRSVSNTPHPAPNISSYDSF